jgi:hypothetical protein
MAHLKEVSEHSAEEMAESNGSFIQVRTSVPDKNKKILPLETNLRMAYEHRNQ